MDFPSRDGADIIAPLDLQPLPNNIEWDGRIAFLDRDGVLNVGKVDYVNCIEDLVVLPLAAKSVGDLRRSGFRICVVTNQSPVNRGLWSHDRLREIHVELRKRLLAEDEDAHLDLVLYSPYVPWSGAWARKPNPGMLEAGRQIIDAASEKMQLDSLVVGSEYSAAQFPEGEFSCMVGDRPADIKAGLTHGVRTFLVEEQLGIADVILRILDFTDRGDDLSVISGD